MSSETFDVITLGRVGVDIYPEQVGVPLADVTSFARFLGGSATNVAVAAARHGRRAAVVTRTGEDPFGGYVHRALKEFGVDDRWVTGVAGVPTPVTFCEIFPPDDFPIYFYRYPKAPDLEVRAEELDLDAVRAAGVFWTTGTALSQEPSRTATLTALAARDRRHPTIHDLDHRPTLWPPEPDPAQPAGAGARPDGSPRSARDQGGGDTCDTGRAAGVGVAGRWAREALRHATVAVGNLDEVFVAVGSRDAHEAADALLDLGVELAVVKQGPHGVLGRTRRESVVVPPVPVQVVNGLGAGDAFGGALCHGLLAGWPLDRVLRFANAAGAIVASRLACSTAMPYTDEVEAFLRRSG